MKINTLESFNEFRNRKLFGEFPLYYLTKKINILGYEIDNDDSYAINEDAFYLSEEDLNRLIKNINHNYRQIHDECDFYNAASEIKIQINRQHLKNGVKLFSLSDTYIDEKVIIKKGATIFPNTYLEGKCNIEENTIIGPDSKITQSNIGKNTSVLKSVVIKSNIGQDCQIGPFSYIRPDSKIGNFVKIGDFVEIKKSIIKDKTKISHLTYIGDSNVGRNCNIACGVITANYDGIKKYQTNIGDNSFIGCNVTMISPVNIENDTYIAAGSTITNDVKENELAIARNRQINKKNWVINKGFKRIEKD